jgi:hypothetical protein
MFNFIHCEASTFDIVLTLSILGILFCIDMWFTLQNLRNLRILYPKTYLKFEQNIFMKALIRKMGLGGGFFAYLFICGVLFWIAVWWLLNPSLLIGVMFVICFLIHYPNYLEIRRRLKKKVKKFD